MQIRPYLPDTLANVATIHDSSKTWWERLERLSTSNDDEFIAGFFTLIATLEHDFQCEEALMEKNDYHALASHREQHARMLMGLHRADPYLMQKSQLASARKAVLLFQQQLQVHRATMDFALVINLRQAANPNSLYAAKSESQYYLPRTKGRRCAAARDTRNSGFRGR